MKISKTLALLAALLGVCWVGGVGAATAPAPLKGSFWYIIDNITETTDDAEAVIWVTLPPVWHGQEVTIGAIEPAPVAILEDAATGNRIIEWRLAPGARAMSPAGEPWQQFCHYDFELRQIPVRKHGPYEVSEPYDRTTPDYKHYTAEEPGIQTDGRIRDLAREIVGQERDPYRLGRMLYGWILDNLIFMPNSDTGWDALSISQARRGNCDQFSTLYVALCRSLGMPARTVANTWLRGGRHVFAEIMLPGHGWVPVDTAIGQLLTEGRGGLSEAEVEATLRESEVPLGDAGWTYGNLFGNRLIITLGKNISFKSPTLNHQVTLQTMRPGGIEAHPAGYRLRGYNADVVHGGFYSFEDETTEEQAHVLAHQRLARLFFTADLDDFQRDVCRQTGGVVDGGVQNWINLGKSHLHKGNYYKAEAAFRRGLRQAEGDPHDFQALIVWLHNYLGNCYDLLGQREMAVAQYEQAQVFRDDFQGAVRYAQRYLDKPFVMK